MEVAAANDAVRRKPLRETGTGAATSEHRM